MRTAARTERRRCSHQKATPMAKVAAPANVKSAFCIVVCTGVPPRDNSSGQCSTKSEIPPTMKQIKPRTAHRAITKHIKTQMIPPMPLRTMGISRRRLGLVSMLRRRLDQKCKLNSPTLLTQAKRLARPGFGFRDQRLELGIRRQQLVHQRVVFARV